MKNKKKIMILDDERDFLNEIVEYLNMSDYITYCLFDNNKISEIVDKVKEISPDIIIMDIYMKDKIGFDIVKDIKMYPELKSIPIIMMTGFKKRDEYEKLMEKYKIKECLVKPIYPPKLLNKIKEYI